MNAYLRALKHYADFKGRTSRRDFWIFILVNSLMALIMLVLDYEPSLEQQNIIKIGFFYKIYALAMVVPFISISVRRLHDITESGKKLLWLSLIPVVGAIWLIYLFSQKGYYKKNYYGEVPEEKDIFSVEKLSQEKVLISIVVFLFVRAVFYKFTFSVFANEDLFLSWWYGILQKSFDFLGLLIPILLALLLKDERKRKIALLLGVIYFLIGLSHSIIGLFSNIGMFFREVINMILFYIKM